MTAIPKQKPLSVKETLEAWEDELITNNHGMQYIAERTIQILKDYIEHSRIPGDKERDSW